MFGTISPNGCLCGNFAERAAQFASRTPQAGTGHSGSQGRDQVATYRQRDWIDQSTAQKVPDYRTRIGTYPLWSLLAIYLLAVLCEAPRGSKDLAKFARKLSQGQRRALGIRKRHGRYPAPSQPTFWRLHRRDQRDERLEQMLLASARALRGQPPKEELIALDGKEPKHGGGQSVLTAVCVPSQYYLGSAIVDTKTNEIPVARQLFPDLDLKGRFVSLDALHTQTETARELVLEAGRNIC